MPDDKEKYNITMLLTSWDDIYRAVCNIPYLRTANAKEAMNAKRLLQVCDLYEVDRVTLDKAMDAFQRDPFYHSKDFSCFCSKASEFIARVKPKEADESLEDTVRRIQSERDQDS